MPLSTTPPSIADGRLAQQPLEVHHAQVAPGRRGHRRPGHEHLRGDGRRQLRLPDPGQRLGDRRVRREDHRLGGHHAAGGARQVVQQRPDRCRLVRLHQVEQLAPAPARAARRAGRRRRRGPSPPARRRRARGRARRGSRPGRARAAPRARRRGARRRARRPPRCGGRRAGPAARWPGRPGACPRARRAARPCPGCRRRRPARAPRSHSSWCRWPRRVSRPVVLAHGDPAQRPVAGAVGLHRDVDHGRRHAGRRIDASPAGRAAPPARAARPGASRSGAG